MSQSLFSSHLEYVHSHYVPLHLLRHAYSNNIEPLEIRNLPALCNPYIAPVNHEETAMQIPSDHANAKFWFLLSHILFSVINTILFFRNQQTMFAVGKLYHIYRQIPIRKQAGEHQNLRLNRNFYSIIK